MSGALGAAMRGALRRLKRRLARRPRREGPRALILLYHRVCELPSDPQLLAVTPGRFEQHLEVLRQRFRPMELAELCAGLARGEVPDRAVAITFDDGYADNLTHARPALERHGVPATVYVAAGWTGTTREPWWDELEALLLSPGPLPETLRLSIGGQPRIWHLKGATRWEDHSALRHQAWNVTRWFDPSARHRIYRELHPLLRRLAPERRDGILSELWSWSGRDRLGRPSHRMLTAEELKALARDDLVEIGAHTVDHPVLAALPLERQRREIEGSKAMLEKILGRGVSTFSYPFGAADDFGPETVSAVRAAGFTNACANIPGLVRRDADAHRLPREIVRDWEGGVFTARLERWFRDG
ncbi:MAG TPA: polysaccharide deacetylase family protein [Candidatus Eisenbacteria bacterium]|jgi:peptidoglycan/xylan/chitin deacetylase (PgdA/CDA1 family)